MTLDPVISAIVVMRPRSGPLTGYEAITAETVGAYVPEPGDVQRIVNFFTAAGFGVGPMVGLSFSITAPRSRFAAIFGVAQGGADWTGGAGVSTGLELPLAALPPDVRDLLESVAFTPPPDFGPTEYGR
jgi:hypothetical protein